MSLALFYKGAGGAAPRLSVTERTPDLEMRCTWRPEQFSRITNPDFAASTSGWSVGAGINAAGVSVTRVTTDGPSGTCGEIVTAAATLSGVNHDLGADRYPSDAEHATLYEARLWLRRVSGGRRVRVILGSLGTTADRAVLTVEDLADDWQEHVVTWRPSADRTDAELAIVTGDGIAVTFRVAGVRVHSPLGSQVENGHFETDTSGWDIAAGGIAAAATSLDRVTPDAFGGTASAELVTTATSGSGAEYALGYRRFIAGRTYRLRVALRRISGAADARLRLGSIGTAGDRGDATVTLTGSWAWHTVDWTPSADRTDVSLAISNASAAVLTVRLDEVEVYEALDDVAVRVLDAVRGSMGAGTASPVGAITATLPDPTGAYDPFHAGAALAGSLSPGVRLHARAVWSGRLHGVVWGRITDISHDPYAGETVVSAEDGLGTIEGVAVSRPFASSLSFADARREALLAGGLSARQLELTTAGPESSTFFDGADGDLHAYLSALDAATGSVHAAEPSPHANVGWVFRTVDRATLTDASVAFAIEDDSRGAFASVSAGTDALVRSVRIGWQDYESRQPRWRSAGGSLVLPWVTLPATAGYGVIAIGADAATYKGQVPFLHHTEPLWGSLEAPDAEEEWQTYYDRPITTARSGGGRYSFIPEGYVWRKRTRRIIRWQNPAFPMRPPAAGLRHEVALDFNVPMEGITWSWTGSASIRELDTVRESETSTLALVNSADTGLVYGIAVVARPWIPLSGGEVVVRAPAAGRGKEETVDGTYIATRAVADGLGRYLVWRYGEARARATVTDGLVPARQLAARIGDHCTATVARYRLSSARTVVRGIRQRITSPAPWLTDYGLEALPAGGAWVTIDGGASAGVDSAATLAR